MARVTVEDCLEKVPSRFALVVIASKRTRQIVKGSEPMIKSKNKAAVTALREIANDSIGTKENIPELIEQTVEAETEPHSGGY